MKTVVINSYKPQVKDYCNVIVVDNDNKVIYIFDSDGTYTTYAQKDGEAATKFYVDSLVSRTDAATRKYSDENDAKLEDHIHTVEDSLNEEIAARKTADENLGKAIDSVSTDLQSEKDSRTQSEMEIDQRIDREVGDLQRKDDEFSSRIDDLQESISGAEGDISGKQDKLIEGENISISGNTIAAIVPKRISDLDGSDELMDEIDSKQDRLIAGEGITISNTTISAPSKYEFTISTSDIGEGAPLAANHFYGVYKNGS